MVATDLRYEPHVGLALGGGGALGAAHVGVLQVLHERAIRPSVVAGTSAGSLIAAAYARGRDPYELEALVVNARWGDFGTFSMTPGLGLLDTDGLRATLEEIGGDHLIEDLPVRYSAVATDLNTQQRVLIDHGSLIDAVCASISVPGIFRPKHLDGRMLVDGGLVDNLPIDAALEMGARHVIAVRLAPEWDVLPKVRSSVKVHALAIRKDVTLISPKLQHRSQWIARDLPGLVQAGRDAAEAALMDYPVVYPVPESREPDAEPVLADMPGAAEHSQGLAAFFRRRA